MTLLLTAVISSCRSFSSNRTSLPPFPCLVFPPTNSWETPKALSTGASWLGGKVKATAKYVQHQALWVIFCQSWMMNREYQTLLRPAHFKYNSAVYGNVAP